MHRYLSYLFLLLVCFSCSKSKPKYLIGVSQCSEDIWRNKLNDELRMGTYSYDGTELLFASADDDDQNARQREPHTGKQNLRGRVIGCNRKQAVARLDAGKGTAPEKAADKGHQNNKRGLAPECRLIHVSIHSSNRSRAYSGSALFNLLWHPKGMSAPRPYVSSHRGRSRPRDHP